jgi:hypothetical protein
MDRDTARDWLILGYMIAVITEAAAGLLAISVGLHWLGVAVFGLLGATVRIGQSAARRIRPPR